MRLGEKSELVIRNDFLQAHGHRATPLNESSHQRSTALARVSESLRSLVGELTGQPVRDQQGLLEGAAQVVATSLDRWRSTGGVLRFTQTTSLDRVVGVDVSFEVRAPVGRLTRLIASRARIRLGEQIIDEQELQGPEVLACTQLPTPGTYPIVVDILDRLGYVLVKGSEREAPVVQVIDATPTIAVDASILLSSDNLSDLRELHRAGFSLIYIDFHTDDRQPALRTALARHNLPRGAILVHPNADVEFQTLGIDFRSLFVATRVRRLRADGVPLVLFLSDTPELWQQACELGNLLCLDRQTLNVHTQEDQRPALVEWQERAQTFLRAYRKTPRMTWRLDQVSGSRAHTGNRCHVEFDNRLARERLFAAIDEAQHSIHLQFYILSAGPFTDRLACHLIRRARSGVDVRIIVDALYSTQEVLGIRNPAVEGLAKQPGIEIVAVSPIRSGGQLEVGRLKRRNHRKLIIIDNTVAFVGGRNCSDEYYTGFDEVAVTDWTRHERVPWLDAHVEVEGPVVADIQHAFCDTWKKSHGSAFELPATISQPVGTTRARLVLHEGLRDTNTLSMYEALLDSASDHVYILNDFPILASLRDALLRALARGVRVELLTGCAIARRGDGTMLQGPVHREMFEYMTKHSLEPLIRAGVHVYEYVVPPTLEIITTGGSVRPYVHAKVVTLDSHVASIGSANLDVTASYWEDEANLVLEDRALVTGVEQQIRDMIAGSYRIDLASEYWLQELPKREIAARLWPERLYS